MKTTTKKPVFVISENNTRPTIRLYSGMEVASISTDKLWSIYGISYLIKGKSFGPFTLPHEKMRLKIIFR